VDKLRLLLLLIIPIITNAQNWGTDSILNPSFANDNRFNSSLDLSGNQNLTPDVPDWTQDLILYQIRVDKFGEKPTINSAKEKLWVLEKLGVTGVVLNPVAKPFKMPGSYFEEWSYYTHLEPDVLDPDLGTEQDFIDFVDQVHDMGIKVFLDFEFHGVFDRNVFLQGPYPVNQAAYDAAGPGSVSSLITEHPEFFETTTDDKGTHIRYTDWNSAELMWKYTDGTVNTSLKNWFKSVLKDKWIIKYNLDGLRLDLEPYEVANVIGYSYWEELISEVKAETGRTIVLIPEDGNAQTNNAFALAQENFGVDNPRFGQSYSHVKDFMVTEHLTNYPVNQDDINNTVSPINIVDEVKDTDGDGFSRKETYYSSCISSHDKHEYPSEGHLVYFGYGMLFQPFIPFWFMGNEFDVRKTVPSDPFYNIIYFSRVNWDDYITNQSHFSEVRKMIKIRKQYKNIIGPSTHKLNDKPMVKVSVIGTQPNLPPYAYYTTSGDHVGIVVMGTKETSVNEITVNIPLSQMQLTSSNNKYEFHNLMTDKKMILTPTDGVSIFKLENLEAWGNLIYKIEPYTNSAPSCHINTPNDLQNFNQGDIINIKVDAEDIDGSISKVEFYLDDNIFFTDDEAPYEFSYLTTSETAL
jgi:glycosidase